MNTIITVPAIAAIVYTVIDIVKTACGGDEKFKRFIPLIAAALGAVLGIIAFYFVPGVIETENILVALVIGLIMVKTGHRDKVISALQKMMPGMKNMQKKLSASRVAGVLSMMLSSGFPTDEALEMTENVLDNKLASEKVASIRKDLDEGKLFSDAITNTGLFDDLQNRMIIMGCAAGKEDEVLARIASLNEEQLEEDISRMVNIIEPTLVAVLAIIIGAVLLSVMMSMAGILTSL